MIEFRVIDLQSELVEPAAHFVKASTPEAAARKALGADLVRSGRPKNVRARVYFQQPDQPMTMVRLYERAEP